MTPARQIAHDHCRWCAGGDDRRFNHSRHCDALTKAIEDYAERKDRDDG